MGFIGDFFDIFLITPLTNAFVLLTNLTGNAGIAVILLTIIIKIVTLPLQLRQLRSTRALQAVQPRMQEIQKRYKDPRRRQQEMMKLYREAGINPLGCFSSFLIQLPILFALYRVFIISVGETPESLIRLSDRIYEWDFLRAGLPLPANFLGVQMGQNPGEQGALIAIIIPLSVAASMYMMQKLMQLPTTDERQRAQQSMMNLLLPLMIGFFSLSFPSALGLYWALSNVFSMVTHYFYMGAGPINWAAMAGMSQEPVLPRAAALRQEQRDRLSKSSSDEEDEEDEETGEARDEVAASSSTRPASRGRRRRRRYGRGRR